MPIRLLTGLLHGVHKYTENYAVMLIGLFSLSLQLYIS